MRQTGQNKKVGWARGIAFCFVLWLCGAVAVPQAFGRPVQAVKATTVVAPAAVNAAVKAFIERHAPWKADQLKITRLTFDQASSVPAGKLGFQVTAPLHTDWLGPIPFRVGITVDGQVAEKVVVPATIQVWSDVVQTVKPLGRFQPIEADDIVVKKMNLACVPANVIVTVDQVLGQRARHNIAANTVLRRDQVESQPVVRRGDVVQMVAESAVLKVAVKGMARENGAVGDRIRVMNLSSKKIVYARVVDQQTVQVEF
jgi:flagellar basal body P-ring formation protein FlgA